MDLNSRIRFYKIADTHSTIQVFILLLIIASSSSKDLTEQNIEKFQSPATGESSENGPSKVESRFFGLDGIMGQLFPGFNQGHQGGSATPTNPGGMGFPANSQFYPGGTIQNVNPQTPSNPGIIDDAKHFPQQNNPGMQQYPNQGNIGTFPQNQIPNQGNLGGQMYPGQINGFPQVPNQSQGNLGGPSQMQYPGQNNGTPNQNGFGGSPQMTYPNQGNFGGSPQIPYPNQGNFGSSTQIPYPNQGTNGGSQTYPANVNGGVAQAPLPDQGNFGGSMPGQGNFGGGPMPGQGNFGGSMPDQGNFGGSMPDEGAFGFTQTQSPGNTGGQQYPSGSGFRNQNSFGPEGDGTLDSLTPPGSSLPNLPNDPQLPGQDQPDDDGATAILGRPVVLPPNPNPGDQIVFPDSSDTPSQRQCVQDCQTTSEYNPVCGTNNVTYINPGKFVCARNCGVDVYVSRRGRCPTEMNLPNPRNVLPTSRPLTIIRD